MTSPDAADGLPGLGGALVPGPLFFSLRLDGPPQHKARHRSRIVQPRGKKPFIHNYPDPATEKFEKTLAEAAARKMRGPPSDGPLCVLVIADRPIPKSWSPRDHAAAVAGRLLPTSKPDADNYGKIIDALNGIVWRDDSQVVDIRVLKRYARRPALTIQVWQFIYPLGG